MTKKWNDASTEEMGWTRKQESWIDSMEKMLHDTPFGMKAMTVVACEDGLTILGSCCHACTEALLRYALEAREEDAKPELH